MARYFGPVGYVSNRVQSSPGVWRENVVERPYYGDVLRNTRQLESGEKVNDDFTVSNTISIIADAYAQEHFFAMRYIKWAGAYWTISDVEVQGPRLLLRLGGVYNGTKAVPTPESP